MVGLGPAQDQRRGVGWQRRGPQGARWPPCGDSPATRGPGRGAWTCVCARRWRSTAAIEPGVVASVRCSCRWASRVTPTLGANRRQFHRPV
jgi:hypothetical protein